VKKAEFVPGRPILNASLQPIASEDFAARFFARLARDVYKRQQYDLPFMTRFLPPSQAEFAY